MLLVEWGNNMSPSRQQAEHHGGLLSLTAALLIVVAVIVYGGVRLVVDDPPSGGDGETVTARALGVAQTERMMPGLTDLPETWASSIPPGVGGEGKCHEGRAEHKAADGTGNNDLKVRFVAYACPDTTLAAEGYAEIVKARQNPGGMKEHPVPASKFGDESTATSYQVADEYFADPSQVGRHLMSRARVGTVVIEMHYGPIRDEAGSESQAEQLMRIMCDRAQDAQAQG